MNADSKITPTQRIEQGIAAWDRGDYMEALEAFNAVIRDNPGFPDVHHRIGLCKAMLGNSEGALAAFELAIDLAPTYAEAHFNRGIVLNELGRHDEAEEAFLQAQKLDTRDGVQFPSHVGNQIANTHAELGALYMMADEPEEAVAQYRAALKIRPRYLDIRERLGEALLRAGEVEEARKELEQVVEKDPEFAEARIRLGVALQRSGEVEEAVGHWEHVLERRPDDRRVKAYLASAGVSDD